MYCIALITAPKYWIQFVHATCTHIYQGTQTPILKVRNYMQYAISPCIMIPVIKISSRPTVLVIVSLVNDIWRWRKALLLGHICSCSYQALCVPEYINWLQKHNARCFSAYKRKHSLINLQNKTLILWHGRKLIYLWQYL